MEQTLWSGWKEGSSMHGGQIVKGELLKEAMKSGVGLPFGVAHLIEGEKKKLASDVRYGAYSEHLESKARKLEVKDEFRSEARKLNVEMMEWLTILLYMGRRFTLLQKEYLKNNDTFNDEERTDERLGVESSSAKIDESTSKEELDQAMIYLREQLSLPLRANVRTGAGSDGSEREMRVIAPWLPFSRKWRKLRSRNRKVLKVGEVVDIWLSMIAGDGLKLVLRKNKDWSSVCEGIRYDANVEEPDSGKMAKSRKTGENEGKTETERSMSLRDVHKKWKSGD